MVIKMFGLCEYWKICMNNFFLEVNFINFEENVFEVLFL